MNRVILVDGRPAQGHPRGMGIYALQLVPELVRLGADITLKVALDQRAGSDPWPDLNGLEKVWGSAANVIAWEQGVMPELARRCGADLIHSLANSSPWSSRVPHVVTIHDAIFMRHLWQVVHRLYPKAVVAHYYYRYGVKPGARRARAIITDSEYSKNEIVRKLRIPADRIQVAYLASPYSAPPQSETQIMELLDHYQIRKPYLLALGAIDPRKNIANLVRAFAGLPRSAADMLVLAGFEKAEQSQVPRLIANLQLQDRIKILGYVPEPQLNAMFQGASAFLYPSRDEGFGLPILQAFHLGVPVLTARSGAIPEVAGTAAHFVNPDDPRQISQEILNVLIDPNEAHHAALDGYLQSKKFTWEKTAAQTLATYARALA